MQILYAVFLRIYSLVLLLGSSSLVVLIIVRVLFHTVLLSIHLLLHHLGLSCGHLLRVELVSVVLLLILILFVLGTR